MRSPYELRADKELTSEGYLVDYKCRPRFVSKGYKVDFFGVFDLIAFKESDGFVRWISIKGLAGNRHLNKKEILALKLPVGNQKELWHINSKGEWIKEILV
jgi:hypothetical protein